MREIARRCLQKEIDYLEAQYKSRMSTQNSYVQQAISLQKEAEARNSDAKIQYDHALTLRAEIRDLQQALTKVWHDT